MRLLVTGFGPFPGIPKNPSATLARRLAQHRGLQRAGIAVDVALIPTEYAAAERLLPEVLARVLPDAILMFGVAGRRRHLSIEERAVNRVSILHPDAAGVTPSRLTLNTGDAAVLRGRAPMGRLVVAAAQAGVASRLSRDAGTYLCNAAYFRTLARTDTSMPCVFVHIPKLRGRYAMDRMVHAASRIAGLLLRLRP